MKITTITIGVKAKVPMQSYGLVDIEVGLTAEITEQDDPDEAASQLIAMAHAEVEEAVLPIIKNRLEFAAYLMRHWPAQTSSGKWDELLDGEEIRPIMKSGVLSLDAIQSEIKKVKAVEG